MTVVHNCKSAPCPTCGSEDGTGNPLPDPTIERFTTVVLDKSDGNVVLKYEGGVLEFTVVEINLDGDWLVNREDLDAIYEFARSRIQNTTRLL